MLTSTSIVETAVVAVPQIQSPLSMELHFGSQASVLYDFPAVDICFALGFSTGFVTVVGRYVYCLTTIYHLLKVISVMR